MLLASIGVLQNRTIMRLPLILMSNRRVEARRHRARATHLQVILAVMPTILPPQQLPIHIQEDTRPCLRLPLPGPSQRIHTRHTSNPLEGNTPANRRTLIPFRLPQTPMAARPLPPLGSTLQGILDISTNTFWSIAKPQVVQLLLQVTTSPLTVVVSLFSCDVMSLLNRLTVSCAEYPLSQQPQSSRNPQSGSSKRY